MKSPFPGMDPWLEQHWLDVHQRLCTYACDALNRQLGKELSAQLGERVIIQRLSGPSRGIYPDVRIVDHSEAGGVATQVEATAVTAAEPIVFPVKSERIRQPFIEIIDAGSDELITVIEFLSPTNKVPGAGRRQYRQKQQELFSAAINMVEVDLVRTGRHTLLVAEWRAMTAPKALYKACVFRAHRAALEYYPLPLNERLPAIRIPLRPNDADAVLDLQPLIDQAYANGRYALRLDYAKPCIPPLEGAEAAWAREVLQSAGRI